MGKELNFSNFLTLIRLFLAPLIMYLIFQDRNILAMSLLVIAWLTDVGDGYLARKFNLATEFGKHFDRLVDKILIGFVFFAVLIKHNYTYWIWATLALVLLFIILYRFISGKVIVTKLGRFFLGVELSLLILMIYGIVNQLILIIFLICVLIPGLNYIVRSIRG
ncbi:CDP-alcohol phosphatidyltransferase family protein [Candidatus Woesearchaeota archaeon]|nr:CDP-alcohol phosphatidyltransferase family protein [Candidatus Woesearchaeota archaeon]